MKQLEIWCVTIFVYSILLFTFHLIAYCLVNEHKQLMIQTIALSSSFHFCRCLLNGARDHSSCLGTVLQDRLSFCHWQRAQKGKVNKRLNFLQLHMMMDWSASLSELFISRRQNYHFVLNQKSQIHFPKTTPAPISAWFKDPDQG